MATSAPAPYKGSVDGLPVVPAVLVVPRYAPSTSSRSRSRSPTMAVHEVARRAVDVVLVAQYQLRRSQPARRRASSPTQLSPHHRSPSSSPTRHARRRGSLRPSSATSSAVSSPFAVALRPPLHAVEHRLHPRRLLVVLWVVVSDEGVPSQLEVLGRQCGVLGRERAERDVASGSSSVVVLVGEELVPCQARPRDRVRRRAPASDANAGASTPPSSSNPRPGSSALGPSVGSTLCYRPVYDLD